MKVPLTKVYTGYFYVVDIREYDTNYEDAMQSSNINNTSIILLIIIMCFFKCLLRLFAVVERGGVFYCANFNHILSMF